MSIRTKGKFELRHYSGKRKHSSQIKPHEETGLWKRLNSIQEWEWGFIDHVFDRLKDKQIMVTKTDIISTINHASIIEYKINYCKRNMGYDERVVLRSKAVANGAYNLNVVYSLTYKQVVTVWLNHIDDRHTTLDWSIYDANMKVFGV